MAGWAHIGLCTAILPDARGCPRDACAAASRVVVCRHHVAQRGGAHSFLNPRAHSPFCDISATSPRFLLFSDPAGDFNLANGAVAPHGTHRVSVARGGLTARANLMQDAVTGGLLSSFPE